jgi:hypothetical protein
MGQLTHFGSPAGSNGLDEQYLALTQNRARRLIGSSAGLGVGACHFGSK